MSSAGDREEAVAPSLAPESWAASLLLLPRRAVFVVVALAQIGVELATAAVRRTISPSSR